MKFLILIIIFIVSLSSQAQSWVEVRAYRAPERLRWETPDDLADAAIKNAFTPMTYETIDTQFVIHQKGAYERLYSNEYCKRLRDDLLNPYQEKWSEKFEKASQRCGLRQNILMLHSNPIAHVSVHYSCFGDKNVHVISTTPLKGLLDSYYRFKPLLFDNAGLEFLFLTAKGRFHEDSELQAPYIGQRNKGDVSSVKFLITNKNCNRIKLFEETYHEKKLSGVYGSLISDPFRCEGGGCSMLTRSVLRVAGLNSEELDSKWKRELSIPRRLMNTENGPPERNVWDYIFSDGNDSWGDFSGSDWNIEFYDPELFVDYIEKSFSADSTFAGFPILSKYRHKSSVAIVVDAQDAIHPNEWPTCF